MARSTAREMVMQLCFEQLFAQNDKEQSQEMILEQIQLRDQNTQKLTKADWEFAGRVQKGIQDHQGEIDALIEKNAVGWTIGRMAKVDVCVLRLAIYELLYEKETPVNVVINEAVNLGTWYSDPANKKFINGILGTISRQQSGSTKEERPSSKEEPSIIEASADKPETAQTPQTAEEAKETK